MNSTIINLKTNPSLKKEAKQIASELGLTLSGVINGYLKQFVRTKTVYFTLNNNEENPSHFLTSALNESEKERKKGEHHSFANNQEALDFLDKQ